MTKALLTENVVDGMKSWFKPVLALALTGCSLYLIASALASASGFLDKPIPTGSITELVTFASGAIFIASLLVGGALAVYLNVRFARRMRAEQKAKAMAKEILERISARSNASPVTSRQLAKLMH